jgi:hypothetical protein
MIGQGKRWRPSVDAHETGIDAGRIGPARLQPAGGDPEVGVRRTRADRSPLDRPAFQLHHHPRPGLRFSNGHFTMIGLKVNDKPLLRAYSIVSANYEETWSSSASRCPTAR